MELVVRAVIVFFFLWAVTRLVGRSTVGELSTFQLVLFIVMGDLVQQGVTQQDYSVTSAVLAVGVFALLTLALSWTNARFPRTRGVTQGIPVVIVENGTPVAKRLRSERMSIDDLRADARQHGIRDLADVEIAILETNGRVSFFTRSGRPEPPPDDPSPIM
ncbi:DUF421 domain-containing protein [Rhodococcus rhodnii]|nr:DUF421 domain-containing protein [Rhodococcus rhodnii]